MTIIIIIIIIIALLDEASTPDEVKAMSSSRTRIVLSRLAVVVGVLLLVGVLVAIRLFVHIDTKTDRDLLYIPTNSTTTHPLTVNYTILYPNVTLAPISDSVTVQQPVTTNSDWASDTTTHDTLSVSYFSLYSDVTL